MPYSREFLEEMLKETKRYVPGWLYASLSQAARPRSGGRASHRVDEPNSFEKLALPEIKPAKLKRVDDADLRSIWLRLHQWYSNAKKRKRAIEDIVNAAVWVKQEMESRGFRVGGGGRTGTGTGLLADVERVEEISKARKRSVHGVKGDIPSFIGTRLEKVPEEILIVRDFVNIAGSAAVAEKPADIDVVIRADYDPKLGKYQIDGASLWVALRRFLAPKKKLDPNIQLIAAPQGSFTDYIPLFDLVVRKREPYVEKIEPCPPDYEDKERVIKAETSSAELRQQAERSKKRNELSVGEFFYQPKPTRAAFPEEAQSVERLISMYSKKKDEWLPAFVQKKYDGANHQAHKDGDVVKIYSEDGDDNTNRLPEIADAIRKLKPRRLVVPFELERWRNNQHLPRETVAGYLAERGKTDETELVANIYDVIFADQDIHQKPFSERLKVLSGIGIPQTTIDPPDLKKKLNLAPAFKVTTLAELEKIVEKLRKASGSEGAVIKRLDSVYPLKETTGEDWIKYHNATLVRGIVSKRVRTKGGAYVYNYTVRPGKLNVAQLDDSGNVPVGETFATKRRFVPGDKILIEAETVNVLKGPEGIRMSAWVPRVIGEYSGDADSIESLMKKAQRDLVLQMKIVREDGAVEYLPANVIKTEDVPDVPFMGPNDAVLAFVGASPGQSDFARRESLTGASGATFKQLYLEPIGLSKDKILTGFVVPKYLKDADGKTREPNQTEIDSWCHWLQKELDERKPRTIVALGKTAEIALGERCDFVLPHPTAVQRFGDSGEVGRKLKRISKHLTETIFEKEEEGGETRSERSQKFWAENWHNLLPKSGKGKFVYQHHWRGLTEDETKLSDAELMKTDHSIHGDLRFTDDEGLWGFAVFLGRTEDNRNRKMNDKLIGWKKDDNIELAPKLRQPKEWLNVGKNKPYISPPGGVGATSEKYSKFFALDSGTYEIGVAREHMIEVFLDGQELKGRYLFQFAPVAGRRIWLIDKPEDQTPLAERKNLADVISELKRKKQKYLIWNVPGETPEKINVQSGSVEKSEMSLVPITKADKIKRIVYGIVIDPYGKNGAMPDAHNDWIPPSAVEETAHNFMLGNRVIATEHREKANAQVVESWIEPYPTRKEYLNAMSGLPHSVYRKPFGDDIIHSGSWAMGVKLGEKEWNEYEKGNLNGFSPGGFSHRTKIVPNMLPEVEFIDLMERK